MGLRSKKPVGLSMKPVRVTGIPTVGYPRIYLFTFVVLKPSGDKPPDDDRDRCKKQEQPQRDNAGDSHKARGVFLDGKAAYPNDPGNFSRKQQPNRD